MTGKGMRSRVAVLAVLCAAGLSGGLWLARTAHAPSHPAPGAATGRDLRAEVAPPGPSAGDAASPDVAASGIGSEAATEPDASSSTATAVTGAVYGESSDAGSFYAGWSNEAIAADLIDGFAATGEVVGVPVVLRYAEIREEDAELLGVAAADIAVGGSPDLAILLEGDFTGAVPGGGSRYALFVVDRGSGAAWISHYSPERDVLEGLLPEP